MYFWSFYQNILSTTLDWYTKIIQVSTKLTIFATFFLTFLNLCHHLKILNTDLTKCVPRISQDPGQRPFDGDHSEAGPKPASNLLVATEVVETNRTRKSRNVHFVLQNDLNKKLKRIFINELKRIFEYYYLWHALRSKKGLKELRRIFATDTKSDKRLDYSQFTVVRRSTF